MSLGLRLKGTAKEPGALSKAFYGSDHRAFVRKAREFVEKKYPDLQARLHEFGDKAPAVLLVEVHPGIEELQFHAAPNGNIVVTARTTPVGPGYHRFVTDLVDELAAKYKINWVNADEADNTGYFHERDVRKLEEAFTSWLEEFARFAKKNVHIAQGGCLSLDLPHGIRVVADGQVCTTLGPRDQAWLDEIGAGAADHVLDFFPWWDLERNAHYHQGVALTLAWNLIAWRPPQTDREEDVLRAFVEACGRAQEADPEIILPRRSWAQACEWLDIPVPEGCNGDDPIGEMGYRRGLIHFPLGMDWSLRLNGAFAQERPEGPGSWTAWDGDRRVEARIVGVKQAAPVEEILPRMAEPSPGERLMARNEETGFYGVADLGTSEEGQTVIQGEFLRDDTVLIFQAVGGPDDKEWALGVWESVRRGE